MVFSREFVHFSEISVLLNTEILRKNGSQPYAVNHRSFNFWHNFPGVGDWQNINEINYRRETDNKIRSGYNATMKCDSWGSHSDKGFHLMSI